MSSSLIAIITDSISYSLFLNQKNTVELEPGEVVFRVVIRLNIVGSPSGRHSELRVCTELSDFIDSADVLPSLISVVAEDDPFPDWSFN
jgi:hypothetical protein